MHGFRIFFLLCLCALSPLLICFCCGRTEPAAVTTVPKAVLRPVSVDAEDSPRRDRGEMKLKTAAGVQKMPLSDYLLGVVAAEMPASFSMEALKAQAVAARTDTLYRRYIGKPHGDADCCDNAACCKAYLDEPALRQRWGTDYERYAAKIRLAVEATDGEVLLYEGSPIFAAFHSASDGYTEDCENVWIQALPYLRSVSSPEDGESVPGFRGSVTVERETLTAAVSGAVLSSDPAGWLTEAAYTPAGRLRQVTVGGVTLSGTAFRLALSLQSSAVTWVAKGKTLVLTASGRGHGVGMSQYGAEAMAQAGADYGEILLHYYTGVTLGFLPEGDLSAP